MSKKREAILTTIGIPIIICIPTNIVADPRPYPHYHTYIEPATPYYYTPPPTPQLSEDFSLIVKFEVEEDYMKYSMPGIFVDFAGEENYIKGNDFEDDGKAKTSFTVDRDDLRYKEEVKMYSDDGRYQSATQQFRTDGVNSQTVKWKLRD